MPRDAGPRVSPPSPTFVDVSVVAGLHHDPGELREPPACLLDYVHRSGPGDYCLPERFIGAAAVGDFDGDGWPDLFVTRVGGPGQLLRNGADGTFTDEGAARGIASTAVHSGAAWVDVEGDGDLDLLLLTMGALRNELYLNDGSGHFEERAVERGVDVTSEHAHVGTSVALGDFDLDGYVDLFVGDWHPEGALGAQPDLNRLLRNRGAAAPGFFEDVGAALGVALDDDRTTPGLPAGAFAFAPAFVDLDGDRYPELAVAADYGTTRLYWNDAGQRFVNGTAAAGVSNNANGMGSAFGDFDGDGVLDWFISGVHRPPNATGNRLFRSVGARRFADVTDAFGVRDGDWGWGAAFFDANHDGVLDLALASGWPVYPFLDDPMRLWLGGAGAPWEDGAAAAGIDYRSGGRGLVPFDYDRDGDLDLLVIGNTSPAALLRNDDPPGGWLVVRAEGGVGNPHSLGAVVRVQVDAGGAWQVRHIGVGAHLFAQEEAVAHFGLGAGDAPVHAVDVYWPATDQRIVVRDVARDATLTVAHP